MIKIDMEKQMTEISEDIPTLLTEITEVMEIVYEKMTSMIGKKGALEMLEGTVLLATGQPEKAIKKHQKKTGMTDDELIEDFAKFVRGKKHDSSKR